MTSNEAPGLRRTLGFFSLVAFGVGDILGAGIYALVGKIAGIVGPACWLSFVFSFFVAGLTGLSYAELGSRFPRAGSESYYSLKAFGRPTLSHVIGFLVLMSGIVSMAAVSHAFGGYLRAIFPSVPLWLVIVLFFSLMTAVSFLGMEEASLTNVVCTAVEVFGLLIIIFIGLAHFGRVNYFEFNGQLTGGLSGFGKWGAVFHGSLLAFYAFIGFEDMVKASEEAHAPAEIMPKAILWSLGVTGAIYVLTAVAVVSVVPMEDLVRSQAPLMLVVEKGAPWIPRGLFTLIALFAVSNTALVNFIGGSRLLYGMAKDGLAPKIFGHVHPSRRTPDWAIAAIFLAALAFALTGTLALLAQSTAALLLVVFVVVNGSLIVIQWRDGKNREGFSVPKVVPVLGMVSTFFLTFQIQPAALIPVGALALISLTLFAAAKLFPRGF